MEVDNQLLMELLEEVDEGVYFTDPQRSITFWNKGAERISGYSKQEVLGNRCSDNILIHIDRHGHSLCNGMCPLANTLIDGQARATDVFLHHKDGHRVPVRVRVFPMHNENRQLIGAAELFVDSSEKLDLHERLEELHKMAMLDQLTEVANRHFSEKYLQSRLEEFKRFKWPFGIIFFDIDDFKKLNDQYSHRVGDSVLKMVAQTLQRNIRSIDQVGRWGGEEFIVILRNVDREFLKEIAEKLRLLVEKSSFRENGRTISVTLSGGATVANIKDIVASLVERADLLMYQSKKAGKNQINFD
jgi:diguanylate cyclase (GGDEF)-like protein/PAS domain S-box-containing protein